MLSAEPERSPPPPPPAPSPPPSRFGSRIFTQGRWATRRTTVARVPLVARVDTGLEISRERSRNDCAKAIRRRSVPFLFRFLTARRRDSPRLHPRSPPTGVPLRHASLSTPKPPHRPSRCADSRFRGGAGLGHRISYENGNGIDSTHRFGRDSFETRSGCREDAKIEAIPPPRLRSSLRKVAQSPQPCARDRPSARGAVPDQVHPTGPARTRFDECRPAPNPALRHRPCCPRCRPRSGRGR